MNSFQQCLKIGKAWENAVVPSLQKFFQETNPNWKLADTSDIHRDQDGDQFPDFVLFNVKTEKYHFLDAKKRSIYRHRNHRPSFGFDKRYYTSYKNISSKHDSKVYIAFYDPSFNQDDWFLLDLDQTHDFIYDYGNNGFGEPICYRWYVDKLEKYKI